MKHKDFSERMKQLLKQFNLSQRALSERTQLQESAISHYVKGKREPNLKQMYQIVDTMGINPAWLMGYDAPLMMNPEEANCGMNTTFAKLYSLLLTTDAKYLEEVLDYLEYITEKKR